MGWPRVIKRGPLKGRTFATRGEYRRALAQRKGFTSEYAQRNARARQRGYKSYWAQRKARKAARESELRRMQAEITGRPEDEFPDLPHEFLELARQFDDMSSALRSQYLGMYASGWRQDVSGKWVRLERSQDKVAIFDAFYAFYKRFV